MDETRSYTLWKLSTDLKDKKGDILDVGCCLVGNQLKTKFICTNFGGKGKFRMLPIGEWPSPNMNVFFMENENQVSFFNR